MKILFLCGSLEPGRDGVGDYTRRLAGECIRQGNEAQIVAINDSKIESPDRNWKQSLCQDDYGSLVTIWRWPPFISWHDRENALLELIRCMDPDVVSIQFVPYSFHPKGLPFAFVRMIQRVAKVVALKWHIMFHELWIGKWNNSSLQQCVVGYFQRYLVRKLIHTTAVKSIHTQCTPFAWMLERQTKSPVSILPLFGNIPVTRDEVSYLGETDRSTRFAFFGTVYREWNIDDAIQIINKVSKNRATEAILVSMGRGGAYAECAWRQFESETDVYVERHGELSSREISRILQSCHFGLSAYSPDLLEKSGSAIAMFEHGLPVIVTRTPLFGSQFTSEILKKLPMALFGPCLDNRKLETPCSLKTDTCTRIAKQFLTSIQN